MRPAFPRYDGPPLPSSLNPLNPRHYLMLADWLFFKPSRLKQYLWRTDAELYQQTGRAALGRALRLPAYRNLFVMPLLPAMVLAGLFTWWATSIEGSAVFGYLWFLIAPVTVVLLVMALGAALGLALGVAAGACMGVTWGVMAGVICCSLMYGLPWVGMAAGVVVGDAAAMVLFVGLLVVLGVGFGGAFEVTFGVALGVATCMAGSVLIGGLVGVTNGETGGEFVVLGLVFGITCVMGTLRLLFYLFEMGPARWHGLNPGQDALRHPAVADELAVLPWPRMDRQLAALLTRDPTSGLQIARCLLRNPFQRWAVARAYARWLARVEDPLSWFYRTLANPSLAEYVVEPRFKWEFSSLPTARQLWLGEMAGVFVDETGGGHLSMPRLVWTATRWLRGRPDSRLVPLARLLLELSSKEPRYWTEVVVEGWLPAVAAVRRLPRGTEVALSLEAMVRAARVTDLADIAGWLQLAAGFGGVAEPVLEPMVVDSLAGLVDVATEVSRCVQATAASEQASALSRAVGMLDELAGYVEAIDLPERVMLVAAVTGWQRVVAEAAGRWGERTLREMTPADRRTQRAADRHATLWRRPALPFPNPYMTGAPVVLPLFVGREDIFGRIREVWGEKAHPDSVILYGHRRMGKSSILRNLAGHAPAGSLLVVVDLKGESALASSAQSLLRGLADAVAWAARDRQMNLADPGDVDYATPDAAAHAFTALVRDVLAKLPKSRGLILALDEFEAVETAVKEGRIGREIYDYLRALSQQPRVTLVLAGLHTLDEMSRDYREAFYEGYVNVRVSYLPPEAAERLITRPSADFSLNYDRAVVARIIDETHGQPLLIQRVCQELVHHVNHELFDLEREREPRVLLSDSDAVLTDAFVCSETRYFDGVWEAHVAGRPVATAVMLALAEGGPVTAEGLAERTDLTPAQVREELDYLTRRDLVEPRDGMWDLCIPLMGRWLRLRGTGTG